MKSFVQGIVSVVTTFWAGLPQMFQLLVIVQALDLAMWVVHSLIERRNGNRSGGAADAMTFLATLARKIAMVIIVVLAISVQNRAGIDLPIVQLVAGFFVAGEGLSIIERAAMMGVPIPRRLREVLERIQRDGEINGGVSSGE